MSKNYRQYSKAQTEKPTVVEPAEVEEVMEEVVEEVVAPEEPAEVKEVIAPEEPVKTATPTCYGTVASCSFLRVRKAPSTDAEVLDEIAMKTKVAIDESKSNAEWVAVSVNDLNGYCMRKYIKICK